ncbi:hypothetical protein B0H15DRAFT_944067 [Mycena belliarum]|uniref:Uncharacterized protein n=1 Tax=Mycena belliarum TaxID=1033014 RepID=A0AAD6UJA9_9AGAR|nr:hypothetical protein B0H15DRAFT_944067 [Mycena belliae]
MPEPRPAVVERRGSLRTQKPSPQAAHAQHAADAGLPLRALYAERETRPAMQLVAGTRSASGVQTRVRRAAVALAVPRDRAHACAAGTGADEAPLPVVSPPRAARAQHAAGARLLLRALHAAGRVPETRLVAGTGGALGRADRRSACGVRLSCSQCRAVALPALARVGHAAGHGAPPQAVRAQHAANAWLPLRTLHAERARPALLEAHALYPVCRRAGAPATLRLPRSQSIPLASKSHCLEFSALAKQRTSSAIEFEPRVVCAATFTRGTLGRRAAVALALTLEPLAFTRVGKLVASCRRKQHTHSTPRMCGCLCVRCTRNAIRGLSRSTALGRADGRAVCGCSAHSAGRAQVATAWSTRRDSSARPAHCKCAAVPARAARGARAAFEPACRGCASAALAHAWVGHPVARE